MKKSVLFALSILLVFSCSEEDFKTDLTYSAEQLRYINCPLGGITTGNILINGYGAISEIEIFNRPEMDELPPYMTFFSLYAKQADNEADIRVIEGEYLNEYPNPFGKPRHQLGGLPRFKEAIFHNAYPEIVVDLIDEEFPLEVKMHAWSPFIPLDPINSGLPCAVIEWELSNPGKDTTDYSIAFSMGNPFKASGGEGKKLNDDFAITPSKGSKWSDITFSSHPADKKLPDVGNFRVSFPSESVISTDLKSGGWRDDAHLFWNDFSKDGSLTSVTDTIIYASNELRSAAFCISGSLSPGESLRIPVLFTWHIPYRKLELSQAFGNKSIENAIIRNYYTQQFPTIDTVSEYLKRNLDLLRDKTMAFSEAMITSSVPLSVLDAAISNMAALKTNLLMRDDMGNLHAFEGLGNDFGCCPGNCTHVWNYAQTMAALFPSLERNVRETAYKNSTFENGYQSFRTVFPLSENYFKNIAADGQMGNIMRVYREWKMSGDNVWLGSIWPDVRNSLEFAWKGTGELKKGYEWMMNCSVPWDPNKEGVLRGDQHNTYDINFYGPNMMTGSLYLGALKACSEMAMAMNEPQKSIEYAELYKKGSENYLDLLWNGEYFIQKVEILEGIQIREGLMSPPDENGIVLPKYQFEQGCLSDQLLGQYLAFVSGMGYLMDTAVIRTTLQSIYTNNFREEMRDFDNLQRIYAANDESGLVLCSWPNGDKPVLPFVYANEVWTGVEYQVATSMIFADLLDEGLNITKAVRSRYAGSNRNPFAEIESGRYYARSLASWGVYQAMAGYSYDGGNKRMKLSPAEDVLPIRYFWSAANGWGTVKASRAKIELKCIHGELELRKLDFEGKSFFVFREFFPSHECDISFENGTLTIDFPELLKLKEGESYLLSL